MHRKVKYCLLIAVHVAVVVSCRLNEENNFIVIDHWRRTSDSVIVYSVYCSDTNWHAMEDYAKQLLKSEPIQSGVAFFNSKDNTPKIMDNGGFPMSSLKYNTANYLYVESEDRQMFIKSSR